MTRRDNAEGEKDKPLGMRNVFALGLVSFFTDFSTEMILGILPLFIVSNLGVPHILQKQNMIKEISKEYGYIIVFKRYRNWNLNDMVIRR